MVQSIEDEDSGFLPYKQIYKYTLRDKTKAVLIRRM